LRLFLVRHGETELNKRGCYYGRTDCLLTSEGIRQGQVLKTLLEDARFDRVITSPLKRAVRTAGIIVPECGEGLIYDKRLAEQDFGIFEEKTYKQISAAYPDELRFWNQDYRGYRIPEGESFLDVRQRVEDFCQELWAMEGKTLLVAHKGTLGHMLACLLGLGPQGYWNFVFDQGCYSLLDLEDDFAIIRKLNTAEKYTEDRKNHGFV